MRYKLIIGVVLLGVVADASESKPEQVDDKLSSISESISVGNDSHHYHQEDNDDDSLFSRTFIELWEMGVQAYLENNWRDCSAFLEAAVHEFTNYRQAVINCRLECWFEQAHVAPLGTGNMENLQFFDKLVQRAICLGKCHNRLLQKQYLPPFYLPQAYRERFMRQRPYEYLQLCYYKVSEAQTRTDLFVDWITEIRQGNTFSVDGIFVVYKEKKKLKREERKEKWKEK